MNKLMLGTQYVWYWVPAAAAKLLQSCPTLYDPMDRSLPGFSVHGILQARTLEWVAISFSNAWKWKVKAKSCLTLSDPMDCSLLGSSIHGIFRATVLEWGAIKHLKKNLPLHKWRGTYWQKRIKTLFVYSGILYVCVSHSIVPDSLRPHGL